MRKNRVGDIVSGYVTGIEKYGIFVYIDDKRSGLIHISEITSAYVKNIYDYARVGELIQAKIIDADNSGQLKLSVKGLDYRVERKNNPKIKETKLGFSTLAVMLKKWIDEKKEVLNEKN